MRKHWWKALSIILVLFTIIGGFLLKVPALAILNETIRNLYFHVTMWFAMIIILLISLINSIKYLNGQQLKHDILASESAKVGFLLGALGLATGSIWARFTWGAWWIDDTKLNGAAITMLIYFAYLVLRSAIEDTQRKAQISAVFNIFSYVMLIVFLMVLPRMKDSLHPGNGGNPGFGGYDLNDNMKLVFYPAIIGWTLLATWIVNLRVRIVKLENKLEN